MIPEVGHFALILALCLALGQAFFPLAGAARGLPGWMAVARPAARAQFLFLATAFGCLMYAFITNDFSVAYVAQNSNSALPLPYRIAAIWGAHEGSLLLWATVLGVWTVAVTIFSRSLPEDFVARVLGVMGLVSVGFLLFMLTTSNPFDRLVPVPLNGRDLNPLLQDPGMTMHPPMLYMGYVGFSVAFSFAIAALLGGQLDAAWARWSRPWTNVAWMFLTIGITGGSWWAYNELGWGGWWFWDPVENASFMPWLVGTALMHSLAVTEKRGAFKAWTVLLAIFAFSLSLLGTFLVRSGVLVSVHAFATDPARGLFILAFLGVVVGGSLILYAWRAPAVSGGGTFELVSRETLLLVNNVLLVVAATSILLGTLYPLVLDALGLGKISVGPPYFSSVFVPLMVPLALVLGMGPLARWKHSNPSELLTRLRFAFVAALVISIPYPAVALGEQSWGAVLGVGLAVWVIFTTLQNLRARAAHGQTWLAGLRALPRGFYAMTLAHFGVGIFIVGITLTSIYSVERDVKLAPGEAVELAGYSFRFEGVTNVDGPNYKAARGTVRVTRGDGPVAVLHPEKRVYLVQTNPMTESAIDDGLLRDLYVSLGEDLGNGAWSVRAYYKPYIRWIWLGPLLMALGGLLAASDRRYRVLARRGRQALERGVPRGLAAEGRG
jgi:cytochrome c-type biogenesis protein CcmF